MSFRTLNIVKSSPLSAANNIPCDSTPLNLTGFKFVSTITFLPTKSSGLYHFLIPDTTCLVSGPTLT